jgi:hypothetical protein
MTDTKQEPSQSAQLEAERRKCEPLRTLPDAWREPGVAERIAEWLKRNPHAVTFRPPIDKRTRTRTVRPAKRRKS